MSDQFITVAKTMEDGKIEYTCPICGGWDRLCEVYNEFLPFLDHLIQDLCFLQHPLLSQAKIVDGEIWFRVPESNKLIPPLPRYSPGAPEWRELLGNKKKILSQAEIFLADIGDWLETALASLEQLNEIRHSDIVEAEKLISLVDSLGDEFSEQKAYLLQNRQELEDTGTDPKWLAKSGNQARFVAQSMAGARWQLTTSTSREMIRSSKESDRKLSFKLLKISPRRMWWKPEESDSEES